MTKSDAEWRSDMYLRLNEIKNGYLAEKYSDVHDSREFDISVNQYFDTFWKDYAPLGTTYYDNKNDDISKIEETDWDSTKKDEKIYTCTAAIHGVPMLYSTRIVETMEKIQHSPDVSVITVEVKTLDTPISSFYYYKTAWIVVGNKEKNFSVYQRMMKVELSDYNPFKDIIIKKTLEGLVENEEIWYNGAVEAGYMVTKPEFVVKESKVDENKPELPSTVEPKKEEKPVVEPIKPAEKVENRPTTPEIKPAQEKASLPKPFVPRKESKNLAK